MMTTHSEFDGDRDDTANEAVDSDSLDVAARIEGMFAASSFSTPESLEAAAVGARARRAARWPRPCVSNAAEDHELPTAPDDSKKESSADVWTFRREVQQSLAPAKRRESARQLYRLLAFQPVAMAVSILLDRVHDPEDGGLSAHRLAVLVREGGDVDVADALITYGRRSLSRKRRAELRSIQLRAIRRSAELSRVDAELVFFAACDAHVRGEFDVALRHYRSAHASGIELAKFGIDTLAVGSVSGHETSSSSTAGAVFVDTNVLLHFLAPGSIVLDPPTLTLRVASDRTLMTLRKGAQTFAEMRKQSLFAPTFRGAARPTQFVGRSVELAKLIDVGMSSGPLPKDSAIPVVTGVVRSGKASFSSEALDYLVELASEGRGSGVQKLLELAFPVVSRYCESRLLDLPAAEDVIDPLTVEVCGNVVKSLPVVRKTKSDFFCLVYQACLKSVDRARVEHGEDRWRERGANYWTELELSPSCSVGATDPVDPDRLAASLINHLPVKEREALVLAVVGLSDAQAAKAVEVDLEKLRATRYRALQDMREMLASDGLRGCVAAGCLDLSALAAVDSGVSETLRRLWAGSPCS